MQMKLATFSFTCPALGLVLIPLLFCRMLVLLFQGTTSTKINCTTSFLVCMLFLYRASYYRGERRARVSILLAKIGRYSFHCQRCLVMSF